MFDLSRLLLALAGALALAGLPSGQAVQPGSADPLKGFRPDSRRDLLAKPDGSGLFFVDPTLGGEAPALRLLELSWGRLVDVHALDAAGHPDPVPVFRDLVIAETVQSDGVNYQLSSSLVTRTQRLLVLAPVGPAFYSLVQEAMEGLPAVEPRSDGPLVTGPLSTIARNATLVARFDDLLADSLQDESVLSQTVRVLVGELALQPYAARLFFDRNHGGIRGGEFHSTRVLIDLTVDPFESSPVPLPINSYGLPAGTAPRTNRNVSVRIPTTLDAGSGQFELLVNLAGNPLSITANGPVDTGVATLDVVRAARSASDLDPGHGFLLDLDPPRVLGGFPATISVSDDPTGEAGFEFLLSVSYSGPCASRPLVGDVVEVGGRLLEVVRQGSGSGGNFFGIAVRLLGGLPATLPQLSGAAIVTTHLRPTLGVPRPCWVRVSPSPGPTSLGPVATNSNFGILFDEPVAASSVDAYDSLRLVKGSPLDPVTGETLVAAEVAYDAAFRQPTLYPLLPLAHVQGSSEGLGLTLDGIEDLVGHPAPSLDVALLLDASEPTETSGGAVLRFSTTDELSPFGAADIRGAAFYDLLEGTLRGRPVAFQSWPVGPTSSPVQSLMIPFPPGISEPLQPFGSKLQTLWRYADLGFQVADESKVDLDVVGLSWAPTAGQVIADFFPQFEIRLSHGGKLPDERVENTLLPRYPGSGLDTGAFADNVLTDPRGAQEVVHPRALGYSVQPTDLFVNSVGTPLMPFPLNRGGGPPVTYTWRDTTFTTRAGAGGAGVPLDIEVGVPLGLEPVAGGLAGPGAVPSLGLPLLIEYRCFPSPGGLGLNSLSGSLAINSSALPNFRAFSSGGINSVGAVVTKNPDLELVPSGGFNPSSTPPGLPTARVADNFVHRGQLETVTRESRVHSAWIDTGLTSPDYVSTQANLVQPVAGGILVEYRGATGFVGTGGVEGDAQEIDAYGDLSAGAATFVNGDGRWEQDVDFCDGARYFQIRVTFVNDLQVGLGPLLDSLAVTWR